MMITKLSLIRNIGKFTSCNAAGDVAFRKLTLIFGENGKGKTTLGDILRSLSTGNPDYIQGRATLSGTAAPFVQVLVDGSKQVTFKDGRWDSVGPRVAVYDTTFIDDNIHSGHSIDHDHRKNLYYVIVGEEGVALAKKVDELDRAIRDANRDIAAKGTVVKAYVPSGFTMDVFLGLQQEPNIDTLIVAKKSEVATLERAEEIKDKAPLATVGLPELPPRFESLLSKLLDDVSNDAETMIRSHLESHTGPGGEQWLSQGVGMATGDRCPFCGQSVLGNDLIAAYKAYFSKSYSDFKRELSEMQKEVAESFGEAAILRIQRALENNNAAIEFWGQFVEITLPEIEVSSVRNVLAEFGREALRRVTAKVASPLEVVPTDPEFDRAQSAYREQQQFLAAYSESVQTANERIATKKRETETGDLSRARNELAGLEAVKRRFESAVGEACDAYIKAVAFKAQCDAEKATAKTKLDEHCSKVFRKYEKRINELLDMFGAGFRISEAKTSYAGGNVSSSFRIVINNIAIDLGDPNTPLGRPSFRNTLSAGDRSTLALSFFIAQLENDSKLSDTIVVFDDPFTSQDKARRLRTQHQIVKLADCCRQVIVLSHDPGFLKQIADWKASGEVKTLQFFRTGTTSTKIVECNLDDLVRGDYFENYNKLYKFLHENVGAPRDVVRSIRPLLEGYLRMKQPREFGSNEWLGDMIKKIKSAQPGSPLSDAAPLLDELEAINEYSKIYHHDETPEAEGDPPDDNELQAFIRRTLAFVSGF
jgi:wobble nucleotide-excising tRNase